MLGGLFRLFHPRALPVRVKPQYWGVVFDVTTILFTSKEYQAIRTELDKLPLWRGIYDIRSAEEKVLLKHLSKKHPCCTFNSMAELNLEIAAMERKGIDIDHLKMNSENIKPLIHQMHCVISSGGQVGILDSDTGLSCFAQFLLTHWLPSQQISCFIGKGSMHSKLNELEKASATFKIVKPEHLMFVDYNRQAISDILNLGLNYQTLVLSHHSDIEWLSGFIANNERKKGLGSVDNCSRGPT